MVEEDHVHPQIYRELVCFTHLHSLTHARSQPPPRADSRLFACLLVAERLAWRIRRDASEVTTRAAVISTGPMIAIHVDDDGPLAKGAQERTIQPSMHPALDALSVELVRTRQRGDHLTTHKVLEADSAQICSTALHVFSVAN